MNKQSILIGLAVFTFALLLLSGHVLAMESSSYAIKWDVIASNGGHIQSTSYDANFTVGQSIIGSQISNSYKMQTGYWYGKTGSSVSIYLPLVIKN